MHATHDDSNRIPALWISALASLLTPFLGSSLNIALPAMGREFNHRSDGGPLNVPADFKRRMKPGHRGKRDTNHASKEGSLIATVR